MSSKRGVNSDLLSERFNAKLKDLKNRISAMNSWNLIPSDDEESEYESD